MITASNETVNITATDGQEVELTAFGTSPHSAVLTAGEARQVAVRLLQAADLADPERADMYGMGGGQ